MYDDKNEPLDNADMQEEKNENLTENKENDENAGNSIAVGMCLGISLGSLFGMLYDNVAIGICMGVGIGLCFGVAFDSFKSKKGSDDNDNDKKE